MYLSRTLQSVTGLLKLAMAQIWSLGKGKYQFPTPLHSVSRQSQSTHHKGGASALSPACVTLLCSAVLVLCPAFVPILPQLTVTPCGSLCSVVSSASLTKFHRPPFVLYGNPVELKRLAEPQLVRICFIWGWQALTLLPFSSDVCKQNNKFCIIEGSKMPCFAIF